MKPLAMTALAVAAAIVLASAAGCTSADDAPVGPPSGAVTGPASPNIPNGPGATGSTNPTASPSPSISAGVTPPVDQPPTAPAPTASAPTGPMVLKKTLLAHLDVKSVISTGTGLFFAQNMMYLHTINVYDRDYNLVKIIPDTVKLADFGYPQYPGTYKGAPVEAAASPDGKDVYVSNYSMYGAAPFDREGSDACGPGNHYPNSFVYRIDVATLTIDQVIEVGSVPKFLEVTPNGKYLLVSNWCSYSESIVDIATGKEVRQIPLGPFPRGIAIDPTSSTAYVAIMGSTHIAVIDLETFAISWIQNVGSAPRHLVLSPNGRWLYATINGAGVVDKIDVTTRKVVAKVATGRAPRSMTISPDGSYIYVVNYKSNTMSKVRTNDFHIVQTVATKNSPIGIAYDDATHHVWVACYSGALMVFLDGTPTN